MWVLNVGDIKPAEYQIELFLDMAWNIDEVNEIGVTAHLNLGWSGNLEVIVPRNCCLPWKHITNYPTSVSPNLWEIRVKKSGIRNTR